MVAILFQMMQQEYFSYLLVTKLENNYNTIQKLFSLKLIKIQDIQVLARTLQLAAQKSQAKTKKKNQRILTKRIKKKTKMARKHQPRSPLATLQMQ